MILTAHKRYVAGIDPGTATGIGVYDRRTQRIEMITTTDFFGVVPWLTRMLRIADVKVYVEVPGKFMYARNDENDSKIRDDILIKAGGNRREAVLLAKSLLLSGFDVEEVLPIRDEKWDARKFRQITRSARETNQHERDACRIALVYANKRKELEYGK